MKIISDIDKKTHDTIRSLLIEIGKQKLSLETVLRKKRKLKRDKEKTLSQVRNKKRKEQRELVKIRKSQKELKIYLTEKQVGVKQLEAIIKKIQEDIARAEREERIRRQKLDLKSKENPVTIDKNINSYSNTEAIDQKAQQLADFFNGKVLDLEP